MKQRNRLITAVFVLIAAAIAIATANVENVYAVDCGIIESRIFDLSGNHITQWGGTRGIGQWAVLS